MTDVGVGGAFDAGELAADLGLFVLAHELADRRPDVHVRVFTPHGRALASSSPLPIEPLAPADAGRADALRAALGAFVVTGPLDPLVAAAHSDGAGAGTPLIELSLRGPDGIPAAWTAVGFDHRPGPGALGGDGPVALRDAAAGTLRRTCTDRRAAQHLAGLGIDTLVVPEPALLARRWMDGAEVDRRVALLRAFGWIPDREPFVVVQGGPDDLDRVDALSAVVPAGHAVVVLSARPADDAFASALTGALGDRARTLDPHATTGDRIACVAAAEAVVASSAALLALARAFARPVRALAELDGSPLPAAFDPVDEADVRALDAEYDALAALVPGEPATRFATQQIAALRAALDARGRRLDAERAAMADLVGANERAVAELARERDSLLRHVEVRVRHALGRVRHPFRRR